MVARDFRLQTLPSSMASMALMSAGSLGSSGATRTRAAVIASVALQSTRPRWSLHAPGASFPYRS